MKKLFILVILVIVAGSFTAKVQAQRNCGTMDYLQQQMNADPTLQLRMENYEQALQKWVNDNPDQMNANCL
jgi:hypothetical protein